MNVNRLVFFIECRDSMTICTKIPTVKLDFERLKNMEEEKLKSGSKIKVELY